MSTTVTISGETYNLPNANDNPPWGEDLSDLLSALVSAVNGLSSSNDISTTSFTLTNNQSSAANITGLNFSTSSVRSAIVNYSIYISTSLNEYSETGTLFLSYKNTAGSWDLTRFAGGSDSGITFTITSAGQVQYTSGNVSGTGFSGKLKFNAKTFNQT